MQGKFHTKLFTAIAVGLAVAVMAPIASAKSSPQGHITIPAWLARIQYPGTSSEPTVYMAGPITIPAWLARTQYPGTSSEPTVFVNVPGSSHASELKVQNGHINIPAWLARIQYPGTSSEPTVLVNNTQGTGPVGGGFDWVSALIGAGGGLGIAFAGAGSLTALRKRRTLAQV
jgi:hypothetical protein